MWGSDHLCWTGVLGLNTQDLPVVEKVWDLYARARKMCGGAATLLEWDAQIPPFERLMEELHKARRSGLV